MNVNVIFQIKKIIYSYLQQHKNDLNLKKSPRKLMNNEWPIISQLFVFGSFAVCRMTEKSLNFTFWKYFLLNSINKLKKSWLAKVAQPVPAADASFST